LDARTVRKGGATQAKELAQNVGGLEKELRDGGMYYENRWRR
jgi:hypothetical protein